MIVLITLTIAGADSGPYDLYSNADAYVTPFETGVSKLALVSGYTSVLVPNGTATIKVQSTGVCTNYVLIPVAGTTTTTSSTSSTSTTSTSSTTTTTTTFNPCGYYIVQEFGVFGTAWEYSYTDCDGTPLVFTGTVGNTDLPKNICARLGTVGTFGNCVATLLSSPCPTLYPFYISDGSEIACIDCPDNIVCGVLVYANSNVWSTITQFYEDTGGTPLDGGNLWFYSFYADNGLSYQIDSSGSIIDTGGC
jgi:hypothetical protein